MSKISNTQLFKYVQCVQIKILHIYKHNSPILSCRKYLLNKKYDFPKLLRSGENTFWFWTTQLESGLSPAELLYGRKLRSNLPSLKYFEKVTDVEMDEFQKEDRSIKNGMKSYYNERRKATDLKPLKEGDKVWIRDQTIFDNGRSFHIEKQDPMPILITDFQWRQTEESIIITVPLKGTYASATDVFTSSNYLKINSPPYLFELCLWQPICESQSRCIVAEDKTVFQLRKLTPEIWPHPAAMFSREECLEIKKRAIEESQMRADKLKEQNSLKISERQRAAVQEQINLNTQEHNLIDATRKHEKDSALVQLGLSCPQNLARTQIQGTKHKEIANKMIFKEISKTKYVDSNLTPSPRQTISIPVSFTKRSFPTPSRESKIEEEQEWMSKQAEARRKTGFVAEDLRPHEQDPIWLCDKAKSFYNVGNYLGAVSVYSHALTLNNHLYELYIGRAMAHLALGNFKSALTDSSTALELLSPAVPQNADARAICLRCRGSALASLGLKFEALGELKAAEAINPSCPEIEKSLSELSE